MNTRLKVPCWVKIKATGDVLMCRRISIANARMKHERKWRGLVCHVQNEKGTGLVQYRDVCKPSEDDMKVVNDRIRKRFGI